MTTIADQIREYRNAIPFRPFVIATDDGRSLSVNHPERIAIAKNGNFAVVVGRVFEMVDIVRVANVKQRSKRRRRPKK